ncbi:MAG: hypothetical protein ACYTG7_13490 [Planctomycetota bacterium]|jgi:hypothetical protein
MENKKNIRIAFSVGVLICGLLTLNAATLFGQENNLGKVNGLGEPDNYGYDNELMTTWEILDSIDEISPEVLDAVSLAELEEALGVLLLRLKNESASEWGSKSQERGVFDAYEEYGDDGGGEAGDIKSFLGGTDIKSTVRRRGGGGGGGPQAGDIKSRLGRLVTIGNVLGPPASSSSQSGNSLKGTEAGAERGAVYEAYEEYGDDGGGGEAGDIKSFLGGTDIKTTLRRRGGGGPEAGDIKSIGTDLGNLRLAPSAGSSQSMNTYADGEAGPERGAVFEAYEEYGDDGGGGEAGDIKSFLGGTDIKTTLRKRGSSHEGHEGGLSYGQGFIGNKTRGVPEKSFPIGRGRGDGNDGPINGSGNKGPSHGDAYMGQADRGVPEKSSWVGRGGRPTNDGVEKASSNNSSSFGGGLIGGADGGFVTKFGDNQVPPICSCDPNMWILDADGEWVSEVVAAGLGDASYWIGYSSHGKLTGKVVFAALPIFRGSSATGVKMVTRPSGSTDILMPFGVPFWSGDRTSGQWLVVAASEKGDFAVSSFEVVPY